MLDLVIEKKIKSLISTINTALGQDKPHEQKKYISLGCERLGSKEDSISLVDKSYQRYAVKYFPNQAEYLIDICQNGIAVKYRYDKKEKSAEILDDSAGEGETLRRLEMIMAMDSGSLTGPVNAFDDFNKKIFALSPFALFEKCRKTEGRCMATLGFAWEEDISSFEFVDKGVSQKPH